MHNITNCTLITDNTSNKTRAEIAWANWVTARSTEAKTKKAAELAHAKMKDASNDLIGGKAANKAYLAELDESAKSAVEAGEAELFDQINEQIADAEREAKAFEAELVAKLDEAKVTHTQATETYHVAMQRSLDLKAIADEAKWKAERRAKRIAARTVARAKLDELKANEAKQNEKKAFDAKKSLKRAKVPKITVAPVEVVRGSPRELIDRMKAIEFESADEVEVRYLQLATAERDAAEAWSRLNDSKATAKYLEKLKATAKAAAEAIGRRHGVKHVGEITDVSYAQADKFITDERTRRLGIWNEARTALTEFSDTLAEVLTIANLPRMEREYELEQAKKRAALEKSETAPFNWRELVDVPEGMRPARKPTDRRKMLKARTHSMFKRSSAARDEAINAAMEAMRLAVAAL